MNEAKGVAVEISGLTKVFGEGETRVEALRGIDLTVAPGEFVAVMGASGSGKSTLLHVIGGLEPPTAGDVRIGDRQLGALDDDELTVLRRRHIGFVFQAFNLVQVLTAEENVALPLVIDGLAERDAHARAADALELVSLAPRRAHLPSELSGGEQQRVAIARALVTRPVLLLVDEPTGNLDTRTGDSVMALLRSLADEQHHTILMVTHDAGNAAMADRLVRLRDGVVAEEQTLPRGRAAAEILDEDSA